MASNRDDSEIHDVARRPAASRMEALFPQRHPGLRLNHAFCLYLLFDKGSEAARVCQSRQATYYYDASDISLAVVLLDLANEQIV